MFKRIGLAALLSALLVLSVNTFVQADAGLTAEVARVFGIQRTESPVLHDLAHVRAVETSTNFSHDGMRGTDAEVLAWNSIGSLERAVQQWLGSPRHAAILSDPDYGTIGCGSHATPDATYYVCLLGRGGAPAPKPPAPATPAPAPPAPPQAPVSAPPAEVSPPMETGPSVDDPATPPGNRADASTPPASVLLPNTAMRTP